jgi:DUF971 family protein
MTRARPDLGVTARLAHNPPVTESPNATVAGSATVPAKIHVDRGAGTLTIEWQDGHTSTYDAIGLRWLCPCAFCRGEMGMPGWLDSGPSLTADQTRLVDLHLIGSYALAPEWADGHHTGYYPFTMLRDRCPCAACTGRRVRTTARSVGTDPATPVATREDSA